MNPKCAGRREILTMKKILPLICYCCFCCHSIADDYKAIYPKRNG